MATTSPGSHGLTFNHATRSIVPDFGVRISFCIFIASTTTSPWPARTVSPAYQYAHDFPRQWELDLLPALRFHGGCHVSVAIHVRLELRFLNSWPPVIARSSEPKRSMRTSNDFPLIRIE